MSGENAGGRAGKSPNALSHDLEDPKTPNYGTLDDYEKECSDCGGKMKHIHGFCPWCGGQQ